MEQSPLGTVRSAQWAGLRSMNQKLRAAQARDWFVSLLHTRSKECVYARVTA